MEFVLWFTGWLLMIFGVLTMWQGAFFFGVILLGIGIFTFYEAIHMGNQKEVSR